MGSDCIQRSRPSIFKKIRKPREERMKEGKGQRERKKENERTAVSQTPGIK